MNCLKLNIQKISIKDPYRCEEGIMYYNKIIEYGVNNFIILIPYINGTLEDGVQAAVSACYLNGDDNRPIIGVVYLNKKSLKKNFKDFINNTFIS